MRAYELLEGGWDSTVTQSTVITPEIVRAALAQATRFTSDFNKYLKKNKILPVKMGKPLGSTAYHDIDTDDKVYGDIDLQMVAPAQDEKTTNQISSMYNKLLDQFIQDVKPEYIHYEGKSANGHPIFNLGNDVYVQVDLLWAAEPDADWARYRSTPVHGVKGLVYGNLYSALGELLTLSIQRAGVQMKTIDGEPVSFRLRKGTELETLSLDQENFGKDILVSLYNRMEPSGEVKVDPELEANPGIDKNELTLARFVSLVKGLGKSFALNDMYGKHVLEGINSYEDFINRYLTIYRDKNKAAKMATKFDKAATPEAKARRAQTFKQIDDGVKQIEQLFSA